MTKKKPAQGGAAVIYARYSSHNQRDVSIEQQIAACEKYAASGGYNVIARYADRAVSGKTDKRPQFQRMMKDAQKGNFDFVIAWKSNRMGRNMLQAMVNESKLAEQKDHHDYGDVGKRRKDSGEHGYRNGHAKEVCGTL